MKLVIKGANEDLETLLKDKGYEVELYDDETELFVEVEKVVEVEKELPEYLKVVAKEVEKLVDEKVLEKEKEFTSLLTEKEKEYEDYRAKVEAIKSIFETKEVVDGEDVEVVKE